MSKLSQHFVFFFLFWATAMYLVSSQATGTTEMDKLRANQLMVAKGVRQTQLDMDAVIHLLLHLNGVTEPAQAILYGVESETGYAYIQKYNEEAVENPDCMNLDVELVGEVASINSGSSCVRLYDERDCLGDNIFKFPGFESDLKDYWTGNVTSIGPCQ